MARACIGIGSNLGDREEQLSRAVELLGLTPGVTVLEVSSLYETEPVGGPAGQEDYLNGAALIETELDPELLLDALLGIENSLGRRRTVHHGPRTIDLDLLLYDNQVIKSERLEVPHPRMRERRFVLEPLVEIAPETIDPVTGLTVEELLEKLEAAE